MSNLLKYHYSTIQNDESARVIDSNAHLAEIVKEKMRALQQENGEEKEFVPGLNITPVDMNDYTDSDAPVFMDMEMEAEEAPADEEEINAPEMDMTAYKEMADEILANANAEAENILANARAEAQSILDNAHTEGFNQGIQEANAQSESVLQEKIQALEEERNAFMADYQAKLELMEPQMVDVVADIFEKVFSIQFAGKREILLNLVRNAVNQIENSKEFLIKVPKENLQFIMEHKEELQEQVGQYVSIEIISDGDLSDNQCIIHTDSGVFDCSLDIQLDNLVRDLKSLSIK